MALAEAAIITSEERQAFATSWNMLARIRNRLHHLSRRKNDQLVFQYQAEMAELFGYRDEGSLLAVEQFMRDVYIHLQTIAVTTDLYFEHVRDVLGLSGPCSRETVLEKEIVGRKGAIHVTAAETLSARPQLLTRLFLQASRTGWPLHHRTKKIVTQHLGLVDDKFRRSSRNAKAFLEILLKSIQR